MSYTWHYIQNNPQQVKRLLGINHEELQQLIQSCRLRDEQKKLQTEREKVRLIRAGGGKKQTLILEDQIILTLLYLRQGITFQILGLLFEVSESTAHNIFNHWQTIFREVLPASLIETVKKLEIELVDLAEELIDRTLIVDSYEQPMERPKDGAEQKKYYSGKKKNHTLKTQVISLPEGKDIVDVTVGHPGPKSDINLFRERQRIFGKRQAFSGDKAYLGEPQIQTPHKKPKNGTINESQKSENKELSSNRIFVEHVIRLLKIFQVARERFRLRISRYNSVILTICGLVRIRLGRLDLSLFEIGDSLNKNTISLPQLFEKLLPNGSSKPDDFVQEVLGSIAIANA